MVALVAGCASFKMGSGPDAAYQAAAAAVQDKKYQEAVTTYNKILVESPHSDVAADALFQLAYVQIMHDNPQKDYAKALLHFDDFIRRYPRHARIPEAENLRFILRAIIDFRKENERLHKNIEELNKLDVQHEERRKKKSK